jgi:L-amino acid N-acyltransferase YncA
MIIYEKLTVNHYLDIKPNAHLTREFNDTTIEFVNMLVKLDNQWAGLNENGDVVVIYGVIEKWRGSAIITSIMSELTGKYMLSLVREAIKTIEELPYTRLEAQVVADYKEGCRLMEVLGFEKGGLLRKYDQYGRDCYIYSRVV